MNQHPIITGIHYVHTPEELRRGKVNHPPKTPFKRKETKCSLTPPLPYMQ